MVLLMWHKAHDSTELFELVGIYVLDQISEKCDKISIDLYRDDGLHKNKRATQLETIIKEPTKTFKDFGL